MTTTEVVTLDCDIPAALDCTGDERTVSLMLDGREYELEVCRWHEARLRDGLGPFIAAARKAAPKRPQPDSRRRNAAYRRLTASRRAWAIEHGLASPGVPGRLPDAAVAAYEAAHRDPLRQLHAAVTDGTAAEIRSATDALLTGGAR